MPRPSWGPPATDPTRPRRKPATGRARGRGRGRDTADGQRGQALVELTLVITIILTLSASVFELGRGFYAYLTVIHAARDGARVAMEAGKTNSQIEATAIAAAEPFAVTVNVSRAGSRVSVGVSHAYQPVLPFAADLLWGGGPLTIQRTLVTQ
jgi:Flp pilus assembly protein TadG